MLFCIGFPSIVTILCHNGNVSGSEQSSLVESGKYVIVTSENQSQKIDVESFLPYVVAGEYPDNTNEEFLKAFAIVLRTYIYYQLGENDSINAEELGFSYLSKDERKELFGKNFKEAESSMKNAVSDTSMMVLTSGDSMIIPHFHALSSGNTRAGDTSYLVSVSCPDDLTATGYLNTSVYSNELFAATIKELAPDIVLSESAPLETFQIVARDESGYVTALQIGGTDIDVDAFTKKFDLKSSCFEVDEYNSGIRLITKGVGDGYGMSLHTAACMADSGETYTDILSLFYPGCVITQQSSKS
jgi:stage II sporulation protein D